MRDLAASQDTSTNAICSMFGSKGELVREAALSAHRSFAAAQSGAIGGAEPLADLFALGLAYRLWAIEHPGLYSVMFVGRATADVGSSSRSGLDPLARTVAALMNAGLLARGNVMVVCRSLWATLHGWVMLETTPAGQALDAELPGTVEERFLDHLGLFVQGWLTPAGRAAFTSGPTD